MSDFFRSTGAFSGYQEDEDERLRRMLGIESPTPALRDRSASYSPTATRGGAADVSMQEPADKNFFERLFAPLQAPQQTLFALSTGRGLWESLSHGARYFNPWSDEQRIDEEEVRQALFGDMAEGWVKGTANFALGLLFDPLIAAPLAKGFGASARAVAAINKVTNPLAVAVDTASFMATKVVGPASRSAFGKVFGKEALASADRLGTQFIQATVNRFHGIDRTITNAKGEDLVDIILNNEAWSRDIMGEGVLAIRKLHELGTPQTRDLMLEALETKDIWMRHDGQSLGRKATDRLNNFDQRLLESGTNTDLFWQTYERVRNLDDRIGRKLVDLGAISERKFDAMRGTHLRRIYQAHNNPQQVIDRLQQLDLPDAVHLFEYSLKNNLSRFSSEVGPIRSQTGLFDSEGVARYFDNSGKLHVKNFANDLLAHTNKNSTQSFDELLTYIRDDMLGGQINDPKFFETISNYLVGSGTIVEGSSATIARLQKGMQAPRVTFRTFAANMDAVTSRKDLAPEIREIMQEILDPAQRVAAEVKEAGGLAAALSMFSEISGVRRLGVDDVETLSNVKKAGIDSLASKQTLEEVAAKYNITPEELITKMDSLIEEGTGAVVSNNGTQWASPKFNTVAKHTFQIPNDPSYGDMAGMWVDAPTASLLRGHTARDAINSTEGKLLGTIGEIYRDGVGVFKLAKTVADPTSQIRNFLGAGILADMGGYGFGAIKNWARINAEVRQWTQKGTFGKYMQYAEDAGVNLWKQDLASIELGQLARTYLDDAGEGASGLVAQGKPFSAMVRAFNDLTMRVPGVANLTKRTVGYKGGVIDMAASTFSMGDQFWKLGVFMSKHDELTQAWVKSGKELTPDIINGFSKQAASLAQQSLFNYADVPMLVQFVRKWGIIPFATFPYKAAPFIAETLYSSPWRVIKYSHLTEGANEFFVGSPEEAANEIDGLPPHLRDKMVLRLPWDDALNRPQYVDLSFFLPWDAIKSIQETSEWDGGFRDGLASPPIFALYDAIRHNKDSLGREIWKTDGSRTTTQNFEALGNFFSEFMLPSWVPGGSRANSIGRSMMAVASTSPEPVKWMEYLGLGIRSPTGLIAEALGGESVRRENVFTSSGVPQPHAQVARLGESSAGNVTALLGSLFGGLTASTSVSNLGSNSPARRQQGGGSELARQVAAIRGDRTLTLAEKNEKIAALRR